MEQLDKGGMYDPSGIDQPDGMIDFEEFMMSARKIPGIHRTFPGISEFMTSFLDMFCNENQ